MHRVSYIFKKKIKSRTFSEVLESTNLQRKVKLLIQTEKKKYS
jgi:hypothetical protein